ncbi:putative protein tyrosine phosphatase [Heterostelium album PN500]|uniref:protein-tyrosine-phosphatase n=1 Tax=Heterostelium pallidum (strain ATCC 26659 / Pp 5 / PN500) TaxID=670386 RepID=D3B5A7_HETP5|nr:putative protein tyrosine phosphatase [Heterostelium album PN500]EFA83472.1 putative protein tyrosine phosphatase [Heterostelium album PN500]|eukprot:XP_020435589.1 putative protein tyrosine phosphatase [Heterostelium album PN500]
MDRFLVKKSINPGTEQQAPQPKLTDNNNNSGVNNSGVKPITTISTSTTNKVENGKENKPTTSTDLKKPINEEKEKEKEIVKEKSTSKQSTSVKSDNGSKKNKSKKEDSSKTTDKNVKSSTTATPSKLSSKKDEKSDEKKQTKNSTTVATTATSKKSVDEAEKPEGLKQTCVSNFFRPVAAGDAPAWKYLFEKEAAERAERERLEREQREKEEEEERIKKAEEKKKRAEQKKQRDKERRQREEEEWQEYKMAMESRNKGFEIVPQLYLGSFAAAKNQEWLSENNITRIVNVTTEVKCYFASKTSTVNDGSDLDSNGEEDEEEEKEEKEAEKESKEKEEPALKIEYLRVPIGDSSKAPIEDYFDRSIQFIDDAIKSGASVFVHCQQGRSRSPSIIMVYLMKILGWTLEKSWIHVSKLNPRTLTVNDGFRKKLIHFEFSLFKVNSNLDFFLDDHKDEPVANERASRSKNRNNNNSSLRRLNKPVENDDDCVADGDDDIEDDEDNGDQDDDDIDIEMDDVKTTTKDTNSSTTSSTSTNVNNNTAKDEEDEENELIGNLNLEELKVVKRRRGNRVIED